MAQWIRFGVTKASEWAAWPHTTSSNGAALSTILVKRQHSNVLGNSPLSDAGSAQSTSCNSLLLALVLVELQNTCKKMLNRKMLERPNICYIFEKLGVQGCQIWHSHVSIPFNSAPARSTRLHNAESSLYHHFKQTSWKWGSQIFMASNGT